jgi:hypothetical protein
MDKPRDLYTLGLNVCGAAMLAALATGAWGYFLGTSPTLLVIFALAAVVGSCGIGLVAFDYYKRGQR